MSYDDDDVFDLSKPLASDSASHAEVDPETSSSNFPDLPENIPSYLRKALSQYLQENPDFASSLYGRGREIPPYVSYLRYLTEAFSKISKQGHTDTLNRAIFTILDNLTDGQVSRLTRAYDFERSVQAVHICLSLANDVYISLTQSEKPATTHSQEFTEYLLVYIDILKFSLEHQIEQYRIACDFAGIDSSDLIIDTGYHEAIDAGIWHSSGFNMAKSHYLYGDVSDVCKGPSNHVEAIAQTFQSIIYTGEQLINDEIPLPEQYSSTENI